MRWWPFKKSFLSTAGSSVRDGWWRVSEPFSGAWQRNIEWKRKDVLRYHAVFACISLISGDISKLPIRLMRKDSDKIWIEIPNEKHRVIEKPNDYQNRIQFYENWMNSKLIRGNAYIYKERSNGRIIGLHVLHPDRVLPLVSDEGEVFYQLSQDNLSGISEVGITVPASEIIHDRFNCFYHPLVGLSPLYASGLPAYLGLKMLTNSSHHFENGARPSGILTIPEAIDKDKAKDLREQWEANYGGDNYGKTAILGGDLKYTALSMSASESQLIQLLGMTDVQICSTFLVPPYKIGVGQLPSYNNVEALNVEYFTSAVQKHIEAIEKCLDDALGMPEDTGVEFDVHALLRMDQKSQIETLGKAVEKAIYSPNEARFVMNMSPVDGGDKPFLQQQMWPISELSNRPAEQLTSQPNSGSNNANNSEEDDDDLLKFVNTFTKGLLDV